MLDCKTIKLPYAIFRADLWLIHKPYSAMQDIRPDEDDSIDNADFVKAYASYEEAEEALSFEKSTYCFWTENHGCKLYKASVYFMASTRIVENVDDLDPEEEDPYMFFDIIKAAPYPDECDT
ncbi:hypothetical protein SAMN02910317_01343 [Ruminococcaceae bacterium FB2012]|nr:hypothetical protein SAMN02910317_01343 [Ruminococcaceae bacterium FB2012]